MDLKEIRKIVELMNEHDLTHFHLEKEDFSIELEKGGRQIHAAPAALPAVAPAAATAESSPEAAAATPSGEAITSPMVGTFYRKPGPDAENFVNVGDAVSEGQVICIIEAMKVMNEIKAEKSGTVAEICVDDSSSVQFGDVLLRLK